MVKITLEDKGQDLLWLKVNEDGFVEKAGPFQDSMWREAFIPYWSTRVGQFCPIHQPPFINFGYLRYKIVSIENE